MADPPLPPRAAKTLGSLFVIGGLVLAGGMAVITYNMAPSMLHPGVAVGGSTWTGDHAFTVKSFLIFGAVFLFGLGTIANGLWVMRHGAFHPLGRVALLTLAAILAIGVVLFILGEDAGG